MYQPLLEMLDVLAMLNIGDALCHIMTVYNV